MTPVSFYTRLIFTSIVVLISLSYLPDVALSSKDKSPDTPLWVYYLSMVSLLTLEISLYGLIWTAFR